MVANASRVVAGGYTNAATFTAGSLTATGTGSNGVLVAYSPTGTPQWIRRFAGTGTSAILGVSQFSNGDLAVGGRFTDVTDFGGTSKTAVSPYDAFVARYAASTGALVWVVPLGSVNDEQVASVAVDASDRVDITGYFRGSLVIGGTTLTSCCGSDLSVFVAQLTSAGVANWAKTTVSDTGTERGYAVAADATGNVYVAGKFSKCNFGSGVLTAAPLGGDDGFTWSLTSAGAFRWVKQWGAAGSDGAGSTLVTDGTGLYLIGNLGPANPITDGTVTFAGTSLPQVGGSDVLVGRYNAADGTEVWGQRFGGTGNEYQGGITILQGGGLLAAFTAESTALTVGATSLPGSTPDFVTAAVNASTGAIGSAKRFGGTSADSVNGAGALGTDGVAAGYFYSNFTLAGANGSPLTSAGANADAVVVRVTP